jgi:hypothetical protein
MGYEVLLERRIYVPIPSQPPSATSVRPTVLEEAAWHRVAQPPGRRAQVFSTHVAEDLSSGRGFITHAPSTPRINVAAAAVHSPARRHAGGFVPDAASLMAPGELLRVTHLSRETLNHQHAMRTLTGAGGSTQHGAAAAVAVMVSEWEAKGARPATAPQPRREQPWQGRSASPRLGGLRSAHRTRGTAALRQAHVVTPAPAQYHGAAAGARGGGAARQQLLLPGKVYNQPPPPAGVPVSGTELLGRLLGGGGGGTAAVAAAGRGRAAHRARSARARPTAAAAAASTVARPPRSARAPAQRGAPTQPPPSAKAAASRRPASASLLRVGGHEPAAAAGAGARAAAGGRPATAEGAPAVTSEWRGRPPPPPPPQRQGSGGSAEVAPFPHHAMRRPSSRAAAATAPSILLQQHPAQPPQREPGVSIVDAVHVD